MARSLPSGTLRDVAEAWCNRLEGTYELTEARDYYCGRGFKEAVAAAAALKGDLIVVSAGLGLVKSATKVPAYSLTVSRGHPDSVMPLVSAATSAQWWREIAKGSPFSTRLDGMKEKELLVVALPGPYLELLLPALERWTEKDLRRVRILCRPDQRGIPDCLKSSIIAYDDRLEGGQSPLPGTMADFASRAGRHFVENVLQEHPKGTASIHRQTADALLATYGTRDKVSRPKMTDGEITTLIRKHWNDVEGKSSRMLRFLRDNLGVACEQGRFRDLFRAATTTQTSKRS